MTAAERDRATRSLRFLEDSQSLPPETIQDLKVWWAEKLREQRKKIIPFRKGDDKYETFEEMRFLR